MECLNSLVQRRICDRPVIFSLGSFDGVHLGHQYLLSEGKKRAKALDLPFVVLTFSTSPRQLLFPQDPPLLLTSPSHKRRFLEASGVDILIEIPFTEQLMAMDALTFVQAIEVMVSIDTWVGGKDLRFGKNQEGGCTFLERRAERTGMKTVLFDRITVLDEMVSSSRIRTLICSGELSLARALLGRPYSFEAPCLRVENKRLPAHFCTFYIDGSLFCLPPDGVYTATALLGEDRSEVESCLHVLHDNSLSAFCEVVVQPPSSLAHGVEFLEVIPHLFHPKGSTEQVLLKK